MFNRYIDDMFLFPDKVCLSNYADDTLYNTKSNILHQLFLSLQKSK